LRRLGFDENRFTALRSNIQRPPEVFGRANNFRRKTVILATSASLLDAVDDPQRRILR